MDQASRDYTEITHVIDTHVHADHISGARELAKKSGAKLCMHESSNVNFAFEKLKENDVLEGG